MSFKRRQFLLVLSSLSGFSLAFLSKILRNQNAARADLNSAIASSVTLKPAASETLILRFVSIADTGTGTESQYAVAKAMARYHSQNEFNLAILAGDNIYNDGEIEKINAVFERPYQPLLKQGVKFHACLGNHDIRTDNGAPQVSYPGSTLR